MTKRKYEKLDAKDQDIVDVAFLQVAECLSYKGIKPLYNDYAEYLVNAITEYLMKCKEKDNDKT